MCNTELPATDIEVPPLDSSILKMRTMVNAQITAQFLASLDEPPLFHHRPDMVVPLITKESSYVRTT